MTSPKQVNESRLERENIFKTDTQIKTIKKQQVASNCHSHSPFKETIITLPKEINPKIKQQIIEREKKIFIRKNVCNEFSNQIEFMNRTEFLSKNDVMNQNDLLKNEFSKKKSEFSEIEINNLSWLSLIRFFFEKIFLLYKYNYSFRALYLKFFFILCTFQNLQVF